MNDGLYVFHYGDDLLNLLRTIPLFLGMNCLHLDYSDRDSVGLIVDHCLSDLFNDFYVVFSSWLTVLLLLHICLLYTSPSPRDGLLSRMPSSA